MGQAAPSQGAKRELAAPGGRSHQGVPVSVSNFACTKVWSAQMPISLGSA
jgi:hypothetical protein